MTVAIAVLIGTPVLSGRPPSVWFEDKFDSYGTGKLADKGPKWGYAQVIEPGRTAPVSGGTTDVNVRNGGMGACSDPNYVVMQGYQGNWGGRSLLDPGAAGAETQRPPAYSPGVAWDSLAAGNVQILYFRMKRAYDELADPPFHAGIYLIDNDPFNPQPIMGWVMSCKAVKPQLYLPTNAAPNWTTNRYFSPEGSVYPLPPNNDCQEFTAVYDPATGEVKFYVDAVSTTVPLWTANAGPGRVSRSVYIRDFGWHGGALADVVYIDDVVVGTTARPVVTSPAEGAFVDTNTPTITWQNALATGLTAYRVRVCTADNPAGPVVYDSGEVTGSSTSHKTAALPTCTQLWAFVNEKYGTTWTDWSLQGRGGFYCVTQPPPVPTVTSPLGTVVGGKPSVIFTGTCYNQFRVKITTDPDGVDVVWDSGVHTSVKNGAGCGVLLAPDRQYYAFAQTINPLGSSPWSTPSPFKITRVGEHVDFRGMEETYSNNTKACWEEGVGLEGFSVYCGGGMNWVNARVRVLPDPFDRFPDYDGVYPAGRPCDWWPSGDEEAGVMLRDQKGHYIIPPIPDRAAPSYVLDIWDTGSGWNDNVILLHGVAGLDLDKGVTFLTYARGKCYEGENCGNHSARQIAQQAQIYIMNDYGTGKCMASFRYGQGEVGICTDGVTWTSNWYTDTQEPDRPGQGWHLVRITGRNQVVGDPSTTLWKYYLDEDPTPLIIATGTMDQAIAPYGAIVDAIAIGQGDGGLVGNWQYDWTAVNTNGDYGPGEWFAGGEFATVSEAVAGRSGGPCKVTGEAVIVAVRVVEGSQVGFWVQDVNSKDHIALYIPSTDTTNVAVGNKVTGITGIVQWVPGQGAVLNSAGFTVTEETAEVRPILMNQKALGAGGFVTQYPEGLETTGKFVRIVGRIMRMAGTFGDMAVYVDDGSGLVDGRSTPPGDPGAVGVRIYTDDILFPFMFGVGDYVLVDGICAYETWTEGSTTRTVRTILAPRFEKIPEL
ncbi:MAG: hypothetical protein QHI38_11045 [Armatimonadota bacterium]|nr:hypothetical protein [Armatimonadota bacterium]